MKLVIIHNDSDGYTWQCTSISPSCILGKSEYASIEIMTLEEWFNCDLIEVI